MKKLFTNKNLLSLALAMSVLLVLPFVTSAQITGGFSNGLGSVSDLFPHYGIAGSSNLTGYNGLIYNVIDMLLTIAGALAVLFLIIGGFWYITSAGNEEQAEKGKTTLINAIIGIIIIVLSYVIITVIANFVAGGG